jgi:hypothetical protein
MNRDAVGTTPRYAVRKMQNVNVRLAATLLPLLLLPLAPAASGA